MKRSNRTSARAVDFTPCQRGRALRRRKARFTDASGHLLPPDQIMNDPDKLAAYDAWLEANGRGGDHDDAFGQKTVDLANSEQGAFTRAVDRYGPDD